MRIELLNVECEFQVPVVFGRRNVYVTTVDTAASTSDMNNIAFRLCAMGYQSIHVTSQRTGNNETKAYPTIRICLLITLTGDCLSRNAQMSYAKCPCGRQIPSPRKARKMTLNIRYGNGVLIVVLWEVTTLTEYILYSRRRRTVIAFQN